MGLIEMPNGEGDLGRNIRRAEESGRDEFIQ
jgi:hypothetical protein